MASKNDQMPKDTKLMFIKFSRGLSYFVYGYAITAMTILGIGFFFLLFSANPNAPFAKFIYETATAFMTPFRGIFPPKPVGETGFFSPSILFAIMMYALLALGMNALISYVTLKMILHEEQLEKVKL